MYELEEANLSHLRKKFKDYDIATISASRDIYDRKEKRDKNEELKQELMNSPYEIITIQGGYPEKQSNGQISDVKERSFFVVNYANYDKEKTKAFEDFMFNLCDKYNQDSIFIKTNNISPGLYDKDRQPIDFGNGPMINMNKLNSDPNQSYYSRINGSKFSFEEGKTMQTESKFKQLVYKVLQENNIDLKEWDDESELKYASQHPFDHTGDNEIIWTLDLPLNEQIYQTIINANILSDEDLKDEQGNLIPTCELDCKIEYEIEGYPYNEELTVSKIYLEDWSKDRTNWIDITEILPEGYKEQVAQQLTNSGQIELHTTDY